MEYEVTVSNHAMEEMVLAASESFVLEGCHRQQGMEFLGRRPENDLAL